MSITQETIGILAGGLALLATIPYIYSILKGHTTPNRATWAVWSLLGLILLFGTHEAGATATLYVVAVYTVCQIAIFLLSLKYGEGGLTRFDLRCLGVALIGVFLWLTTDNPLLAIVLSVAVDTAGALPTVKKAWEHPLSEDRTAWTISAVAANLNIFATSRWSLGAVLYPLYLAAITGTIAVILWLRQRKKS